MEQPKLDKIEVHSSQSEYNNSNNQQSNKDKFKEIVNGIPLFIRIVIILTVFFYLINIFTNKITIIFSNIPYYTIFRFQIWRLITSAFISTSLFNIIFAFLIWAKDASMLEINMGTIRYAFIFFFNTICIQIIYVFISCILSIILFNKNWLYGNAELVNESDLINYTNSTLSMNNSTNINQNKKINTNIRIEDVNNSGLWPLIISEMILLCLNNPESSMKFLFFPCLIKAKFYPLILIFLNLILNRFKIDFQIISGIIHGFLYHIFIKKRLQISNSFIEKIENKLCFKYLKNLYGFISINNSGKPIDKSNYTSVKNKSKAKGKKNGYYPFKGEGVKVGGTLGTTNKDYNGVGQNSDIRNP